MSRSRLLFAMLVAAVLAVPALAGPADLLKQAIEENETAPPSTQAVDKLVSEADRLAEQKQFKEAIALYQKAYRLAPSNQANYVRLLVTKRAAGVMTAQDREALAMIQESHAAQGEQVVRTERLKIIQAKGAARSGDGALAKRLVRAATDALDGLPERIDTSPYRRELNSVLIRVARKGNRATAKKDRRVRQRSTVVVTSPTDTPAPLLSDVGDAPAGEADIETGEIIDVDAVLAEDHERHAYDRALSAALARSRATTLLSNNEAAMPLDGMTFPDDWAEKTRRRARHRDGVIFESKPFTGADGNTYTTAIYDLAELVHPVPNFYSDYPGTARRQRMEDEDRYYLRERSMIFNGHAEDLAAGMPLLHFFGGIDNNAISRRTDPRETDRIVRTLDLFLSSQ